MKETLALTWLVALTIVGIRYAVAGKINTRKLVAILSTALLGGFGIVNYDILEVLRAPGGFEIKTARREIRKEKNAAISEIRQEVSRLQDSMTLLIQDANDTRKELEKTIEIAAPPTLSFFSKEITKTDEGYDVILKFKPSKNQHLGKIRFSARIVEDSSAKIINFWPHMGPAHITGKDSKKVSADGKQARLIYSLFSADYPEVELKVSETCTVVIAGSHDLKPFTLDIK